MIGTSCDNQPSECERIVSALRDIERKNGLDYALRVGALVLELSFRGQTKLWRSRNRHKNSSIRRLAQHPGCPLSRTALNSCVAICVALRELTEGTDVSRDPSFSHVGVSHVSAVLSLPAHERAEWLNQADRQHWTTRELKRRIAADRGATLRRAPNASQVRRALRGLESGVELVEHAVSCATELPLEPSLVGNVVELAARLTDLVKRLLPPISCRPVELRLADPAAATGLADVPT
jgi:hypothetical protein